jgi:predicted metal-dependent enzyme (double-stranded beta helix superfamily)
VSSIPRHIPTDEHVGTHLLYEDDEVRIWSIVLEPGETAAMHTHRLDYAVVTVKPGRNRRGNGDGSVDILESERGTVRFDRVGQGQQHDLTNVGTTRYRNVIVELK